MIERNDYLKMLIERKRNGMVKVITGLRRCGKSYLLFEIYRKYLLSSGVKEDIVPWYDEQGIFYLGIERFLLDVAALK